MPDRHFFFTPAQPVFISPRSGLFSSDTLSIKPQMKKLPDGSCENKAVALRENALRAGENLFHRNRWCISYQPALRVVFAEMPDRHFFFTPAQPVFISPRSGLFSSDTLSIKPQMKKLPDGSCENKAVALRENALRAGENLFHRNRWCISYQPALRVVFAEMPDRHFFFTPAQPVFISPQRRAFFI